MSNQNKNYKLVETQKKILDLEKKYMDILFQVFNTSKFKDDLISIEKEIKDKYEDYRDTWKLKNKIKIPAERIVYHHLYTAELNSFTINNLYTSAVSSDIGIIVNNEVVICLDVKTNDLCGNKTDIKKIIVEKNQNSFDNSNFSDLFTVKSNLDRRMRYKPNLPILTYVLKISYFDDGHNFKLVKNDIDFPTVQLACIPNGSLSECFDKNIISGVKTYTYDFNSKHSIIFDNKEELDKFISNNQNNVFPLKDEKNVYNRNGITLWKTTHNKRPCLAYNKNASTLRLDPDTIKLRYDSSNNEWDGIKHIIIQ